MGSRPIRRIGLVAAALLVVACSEEPTPPGGGRNPAPADGFSLDFSDEADVPSERFAAWASERGFLSILGDPVYFSLRDGALRLAARPGPVHRRRFVLALTDREKLKTGIESKVILRLTPEDFLLDLGRFPVVRFRMAPILLPGRGADLRDPGRNDACFYLLLGLAGRTQDFHGVPMPDTLAYVWANRAWPDEVAGDPEYEAFLRYVAVGHGEEGLGREREIVRDVAADVARAFPGRAGAAPRLRSVAVMVDANTVGTEARSSLRSVRFEPRP